MQTQTGTWTTQSGPCVVAKPPITTSVRPVPIHSCPNPASHPLESASLGTSYTPKGNPYNPPSPTTQPTAQYQTSHDLEGSTCNLLHENMPPHDWQPGPQHSSSRHAALHGSFHGCRRNTPPPCQASLEVGDEAAVRGRPSMLALLLGHSPRMKTPSNANSASLPPKAVHTYFPKMKTGKTRPNGAAIQEIAALSWFHSHTCHAVCDAPEGAGLSHYSFSSFTTSHTAWHP